MSKWLKYLLTIFLALFFLGEAIGRYFGLCSYPLYVSSEHYEYIYAPNQNKTIYRNKFLTNAYSMRSKAWKAEQDTSVILLIGDSVINGGNNTDHDSLASTLLERWLSDSLRRPIRVLNISAGSWGPDNAAAYLKQHGTFNVDGMMLVFSSHDAYDRMTFTSVVGRHPQFPAKQAPLAWIKIWQRGIQYILTHTQLFTSEAEPAQPARIARDSTFNPGFAALFELAQKLRVPIKLYLHSTQPEQRQQARQSSGEEIIQFAALHKVEVIDEMELPVRTAFYWDDIHFNSRGQYFMAQQLFPHLQKMIK